MHVQRTNGQRTTGRIQKTNSPFSTTRSLLCAFWHVKLHRHPAAQMETFSSWLASSWISKSKRLLVLVKWKAWSLKLRNPQSVSSWSTSLVDCNNGVRAWGPNVRQTKKWNKMETDECNQEPIILLVHWQTCTIQAAQRRFKLWREQVARNQKGCVLGGYKWESAHMDA